MKELEKYIGRIYRSKYSTILKIVDISPSTIFLKAQDLNANNSFYFIYKKSLDKHCTDITDLYNTEGYQLLLKIQ